MNIIEQQSDIDNKKTYEQNNILENIKKSSTLEEQLLHLTILDNAINSIDDMDENEKQKLSNDLYLVRNNVNNKLMFDKKAMPNLKLSDALIKSIDELINDIYIYMRNIWNKQSRIYRTSYANILKQRTYIKQWNSG